MKKNIAIVAGGNSGEYEVSIRSAAVVAKNLSRDFYNIYTIVIRRQYWYHENIDGEKFPVDRNDFSITLHGSKVNFDCVFIAIHGTPGEDGMLQGYFELLEIPFTTCNMITSALTFNKQFCKHFVKSLDIRIAENVLLKNRNYNTSATLERFGLPCFVKPNKGGSSVGITKVIHEHEFDEAVENAFKEDDEVIVEAFIRGREITCGVLLINDKITALPITEIVSKKAFFDYEAKYTTGMADEITPAPIPGDIWDKCQETSVFLYDQLNCKGIVRFDYIYNDDGMYFLEVNTVPGLSENSIVPQQAEAAGIPLPVLFETLIKQAIDNR